MIVKVFTRLQFFIGSYLYDDPWSCRKNISYDTALDLFFYNLDKMTNKHPTHYYIEIESRSHCPHIAKIADVTNSGDCLKEFLAEDF